MTAASVLRAALVLSACAGAQVASAACYFVYAPNNELIYRSNVAPVDLSLPLHQTVSQLAPGARMFFSLDEYNCATEVNLIAERAQIAAARNSRERRLREEQRF
ncbi:MULTISPECIES: hypothetical protein [Comamonas]|mgnify:FL=1|uniref:Uncharacterized protein n=1 Tax=Comamonas thiooxydans TaxID=363952 RepID=A0A096F0J6_9BURK|nr:MULTISPECIES: hypothetical protein [Comamonas]ACY33805.1 hypothetical protein CtCNB1_3059 [Comamonas thiooxydans]KGG85756.1 hypothetical protein P609_12195 [Comamonas thiooxydans]KGG86821.1 hypothetical protein P369_18280 [Comamonas thiooxydans]KGG91082.1 hypothetical protein P245_14045 [Comamonas thiooxydans]KGG97421.1 hypothetical protein P367_16225 [Comamonas thiooxydans]